MYVNFYLGLAMTFRESTPTRRGSETSQSSSTKSLSRGANLTNPKLCDQFGELLKGFVKKMMIFGNCQIPCKAISLAKCFFIEILKNGSRGAHVPNDREKQGSKREKVIA